MATLGRSRPVIGFLSDFGLDGAAAICRGVMLGICPDAQIVDISHTVAKYAVADGAFVLAAVVPYLPVGPHVGVVDPGVGTERRPVALETRRGDVLIGPDNGLLLPAAQELGGLREARAIENRDLWLPTTSSTFHGRDIFAPVAAHLAAGEADFEAVGSAIDPATLVRLTEVRPRVADGSLQTEVVYIDTFGNLRLAGTRDDVVAAVGPEGVRIRFRIGDGAWPGEARFVRTFGEVEAEEALLYVDSSGHPALARNRGSLAAITGANRGDRVTIERA